MSLNNPQIGDMDQRVELFSRGTPTTDAMGQDAIAWVSQGSRWAQLVPLRGEEVFAAQQVSERQTLKFRIWSWPAVDATWRLVWQGRAHDITSALPFGGRNERTEIICVQGVKDGRP